MKSWETRRRGKHHIIIPLGLAFATLAAFVHSSALRDADIRDDGDDANTPHSRVRRWEEMPNVTFTFDCTDRPIGFYADLEFDCMIFHLCDGQGRRVPYMCDKDTAFNQRYRVCDWAYNVDCESSEDWYYLNDLTYRTEAPRRKRRRRRKKKII